MLSGHFYKAGRSMSGWENFVADLKGLLPAL